jgi:parvulin-like peptidyl-prolyl isomerase
MTPAKALKVGAALMMRMLANDAAWVTRRQAATERLKAKEAAIKAGASAQEGAGVGDAARRQSGSRQPRALPGSTCLEVVG